MTKAIMAGALALLIGACATEGNQVNEAAHEAGEAAGRVGRIPSSVGEGFGEGMRKPEDDGPYNRSEQR